MSQLAEFINIKRRYSRSVNLERDLQTPDSVLGYIPTPKAIDAIDRFLTAFSTSNSVRAWTITGVYGTGKSAFTHFLASLCAPKSEQIRTNALKILEQTSNLGKNDLNVLPNEGLIRAVVTSQREPLTNSIVKALAHGTTLYPNTEVSIITELKKLLKDISNGKAIASNKILEIIKQLAINSTGILLIIDELGKNLEYIVQNHSEDDLYLLQQIAELPSTKDLKVFVFCILHQSLSDYAHRLSNLQMNEWRKIEGRFEDLPFYESSDQIIKLIGNAIQRNTLPKLEKDIVNWSEKWADHLKSLNIINDITKVAINTIFPLHPISAIVLPILCNKYAQNDRSLFTFLSSPEPHSLNDFILNTHVNGKGIETVKLYNLYDYFVESVGLSMSSRSNFQRWVEIRERISDAGNLGSDNIKLLKTIGILNLISNSGELKASKDFVIDALIENPDDKTEKEKWLNILDSEELKYFITYRTLINELRIWEGSEFDIEKNIETEISNITETITDLLSQFYPLRPLIAQRHSYETGTLRLFERKFFNFSKLDENISCDNSESDGLILYCLDQKVNKNNIPENTVDGKPLVVIFPQKIKTLESLSYEFAALKRIENKLSQLQLDSVARKELKQRLRITKKSLDDALEYCLNITDKNVICYAQGGKENINSRKDFNSRLSKLCDDFYKNGLTLWNELINRRDLTSQGSTARKKLIDLMLKNESVERLGITGFGPEFSLYQSLLVETGIHKENKKGFSFYQPDVDSGIFDVWKFIEQFSKSALDEPKKISDLYFHLKKPPYGVKEGPLPLLLLAVLLTHTNDLGLYHDGTFIPVLGTEHFELLVKAPERFTIKYFQIEGLRAEYFKELEEIIVKKVIKNNETKSTTLLAVVKPLINFMNKLPSYTLRTNQLSKKTLNIRKCLLEAKEPDKLLFNDLPIALGFSPIIATDESNTEMIHALKADLILTLQELQIAYEKLLSQSKELLYKAFSIRTDKEKLRDDLYKRANRLSESCIEPRLKSFILASANSESSDKNWLESLLMIVADKPAESWSDYDALKFESDLSDMVRRFKNLEAIQKELSNSPEDFAEAKRVTVTRPDGKEIHRMVWLSQSESLASEKIVDSILDKIKDDERLKDAVVAKLIEKAFAENIKSKKSIEEVKNGK